MKKIAYLEDCEDLFLLVKFSLRDKADVVWFKSKEDSKYLNDRFDAFICDGDIPGWDDHFRDVTKIADMIPIFVYSGTDKELLIEKGMNPNWPYFNKTSQTIQEVIKSIMTY